MTARRRETTALSRALLTTVLGQNSAADPRATETLTADMHAAIVSAVRAAVPGRQKGKNLTPLVDAAEKAFIRTLRRRAKG